MLNDLDERIVHALAEDARRSYADIGQLVGLSAPAVKRRVDRLRATGAITGFTVRVDPAALGWETEGFVEIYCRHNTSPDTIRRQNLFDPDAIQRLRMRQLAGGERPNATFDTDVLMLVLSVGLFLDAFGFD